MTKPKILMSLKLLSWIGLIVLFIVVSIAAVERRSNVKCDTILVRFKKDQNLGFIQSKDILKEINESNPTWRGQRISHIKFNLIENAVKQNEYVKKSELYLDYKNQINVLIEPKAPIARVNSSYGAYYLSENWDKMSLNSNYSKRIVHISGRVNQLINPQTKVDSFINTEIKTLLKFMEMNKVWTDAIDQIYITSNAKIEIVLIFCEPIIKLGFLDENFEKRMEKLENFFKNAPKYQNISDYAELDFQYSNQVVAKKKVENRIEN